MLGWRSSYFRWLVDSVVCEDARVVTKLFNGFLVYESLRFLVTDRGCLLIIYTVGNERLRWCLSHESVADCFQFTVARIQFVVYQYCSPVKTLRTDYRSCCRLFTFDKYSLDCIRIQGTELPVTRLSLGSFFFLPIKATITLCTPAD